MDPERWLPKRERSYYRGKRKDKRKEIGTWHRPAFHTIRAPNWYITGLICATLMSITLCIHCAYRRSYSGFYVEDGDNEDYYRDKEYDREEDVYEEDVHEEDGRKENGHTEGGHKVVGHDEYGHEGKWP